MTERPTTWVGLWFQAGLLGDRVRAEKLTTRLNSGSPKGWTLDEPAVVRAAFDLAMDRYFDGRYDPPGVEAFAARLQEAVSEWDKIIEVDLVQRLIRQSLRGEGPSQDDPNVRVMQHIHMAAVKLATMELAMTAPEISSLICQAEVLARDRGWDPPLGP
jgi:hypothetical protein